MFVSFILVKTSKDYINVFHLATIIKRVDVSFCRNRCMKWPSQLRSTMRYLHGIAGISREKQTSQWTSRRALQSFIIKMWRYMLFVPRPRSSLMGDGWNLNCDNVIGCSQLDSCAQGRNLCCWQQPRAGDAHAGRAHPPCRGRGAAPTSLHLQAMLWVPDAVCQPYLAIKGPLHLGGGQFPLRAARCVQWKQVLRVANHCSCQGLLTQAPRGERDQEVCLASRANSLEEPCFLSTAWN